MNIEDRYTAVPTACGGVRLIPKSTPTMDAASDVHPARRLVRARTGDDWLEGNSLSAKRISVGKTFTPQGEGRVDHSSGAVHELEPHKNFAAGVPLGAESVESLRDQISLLGGLPPEARGPGVQPPQPVRNVVVNESLEAEDVEFVMREFAYAYAEAVQVLSRMPPSDRKLWLHEMRQLASKRAAAMQGRTADADARIDHMNRLKPVDSYKATADTYGRTQWEQFASLHNAPPPLAVTSRPAAPLRGNPVTSFKEQMEAIAADRNAQFDQAFRYSAPAARVERSAAPVRPDRGYDAMAAFKANMDRAHAAAKGG